MRRTMITMTLVSALVVGACASDVTGSEEYQELADELATVNQELSDTTNELAAARAELEAAGDTDIPEEVAAVLDEWEAALERKDGSIVDLYLPTGYHLFGDEKIPLDALESHLGAGGWTHEWISEPFLVAAEPEGRYVVSRGLRNSSGGSSFASAFTFEIVTRDGELKIAETDWTEAST